MIVKTLKKCFIFLKKSYYSSYQPISFNNESLKAKIMPYMYMQDIQYFENLIAKKPKKKCLKF